MKNKILAIVLLIFIGIESYFIFYSKKEEAKPTLTEKVIVKKYSLTEVLEYLNDNAIEVKNIYKSGEDYIINGVISGENGEFLEKINSLDKLSILDYSLELYSDTIYGNFTFKYS